MRRLLVLVAACGGPAPISPQPPVSPAHVDPASPAPSPLALRPPVAERRVVKDTYHGVTVEDPYRWLEGDDAAVKRWSDGQDRYTRSILDKLPHVDELRAEITAIVKAPTTSYGAFRVAGGKLFALRKLPTQEQADLVVMTDPDRASEAKLVLDPTARGGKHVTIDWFVPSADGTRLAVSLSENGSENGVLHVIDGDGKDVEPTIPNVQRVTAGGDVAWLPDGKGFFYTRYPDGENFHMQVWFHELGKPIANDRYELGKDLPKISEILLETDKRGRLIASVQLGDGGTFRHYLRDPKGKWFQIDDWDDGVVWVGFGPSADLWLISRKDAPRGKLLKLPPTFSKLADAKVVVPEGTASIVTDFYTKHGAVAANDRFYINYQTGGPTEIRAFTAAGKPAKAPQFPPVSTVGWAVPWADGVLVESGSYTTPWTWHQFTAVTAAVRAIPALSPKPPVDLSAFEVHREMATSKDGTQVPVNIVFPKGAPKDGSVPCIVTGYGGYSISQTPRFLARWAPVLQRGVCFADVNLRGGAEFGEDWHHAGTLTHKQNVFDDFAAALALVVEKGYTHRDRLGIIGGSNGGLLMGAMITQHPDMVKAVVAAVGIYDMLRVETSPNGQYNIPEYGSVADEAQFKALYAYSPYHHVVAGTQYPAILFTEGANDGRVAPWQSRKMTAALQAVGAPALMRVSQTSGHGSGTDTTEAIALQTDMTAFLLAQIKP